MDATLIATLTLAVAALIGLAIAGGLGLVAWRDWLAVRRLTIARPEERQPTAGSRIELADLRERVRRLEAIAAGVDL